MDFVAVVDQVIALLHQRGRVAYRTLKRQFQLDDEALEDLKIELIEAQHLARDEQGHILVWLGDPATLPSPPPHHADGRDTTEAERRFQALPPGVIALLRQERRVTYRTLSYVFGLDKTSHGSGSGINNLTMPCGLPLKPSVQHRAHTAESGGILAERR